MFTPPNVNKPMPTAPAFLLISIGAEAYALDGGSVREVIRWRQPTPVPGAPPVLPGIISQRGVVVPMVDLRLLLGLPAQAAARATRLVIVHQAGVDLALLVDAVLDLQELPDPFDPPPTGHNPSGARLISGVLQRDDRPLARLDLSALISAVQEGHA
jgi:purine-binding chemotaxis protein CheW